MCQCVTAGHWGLRSEWWSLITSSFHCQCHLPVQCLLCHADYIQIIDSILKTDISEQMIVVKKHVEDDHEKGSYNVSTAECDVFDAADWKHTAAVLISAVR